MTINLQQLHGFLVDELDYPVDRDTVEEQIGDTKIEAPDEPDNRTIRELIQDVEEDSYDSADGLFSAIMTSLPDEYIGRKYYDDRGGNTQIDERTEEGDSPQ